MLASPEIRAQVPVPFERDRLKAIFPAPDDARTPIELASLCSELESSLAAYEQIFDAIHQTSSTGEGQARALGYLAGSYGSGTDDGWVGIIDDCLSFNITVVLRSRRIPSRFGLSGPALAYYSNYLSTRPANVGCFTETLPIRRTAPTHLDALKWTKEATKLSNERIARLLGISRQAMDRWERGAAISDHHRQRLLAVTDVLQRAAARYPTPEQLVTWLDTPRGMDAHTPAQALEADQIDRARYLAMSAPSTPRTRSFTSARSGSGASRIGAEYRPKALPRESDAELLERFGEPGSSDPGDDREQRDK